MEFYHSFISFEVCAVSYYLQRGENWPSWALPLSCSESFGQTKETKRTKEKKKIPWNLLLFRHYFDSFRFQDVFSRLSRSRCLLVKAPNWCLGGELAEFVSAKQRPGSEVHLSYVERDPSKQLLWVQLMQGYVKSYSISSSKLGIHPGPSKSRLRSCEISVD